MENTIWLIIIVIIVISFIFYGMLSKFFKEEDLKRQHDLRLILSKELTPQKLMAYERMALFLERIKPSALALRVSTDQPIENYEYELVNGIQQEFEHNLSQQIYINPNTWKIIFSAKNATQNFIRECSNGLPTTANAKDLQEAIIKKSTDDNAPSHQAMLYLQKDIQS